eukprot:scaffold10375_cov123-Skeletonema_menzelii.AAC.4
MLLARTQMLGTQTGVLDEVALEEWSAPIVARWDDGSVAAAPKKFEYGTSKGPTTIDDPSLGTGVDSETFVAIRDLVDFKGRWDPKEAQTAFEVTSFGKDDSSFIFASPIPPIPPKYDPLYVPEFVVVLSISKDDALRRVVTDLGETIDSQVKNLVIFTSIAGIVGILVIILVIFASASYLTKPLRWCEMVAREIVNNFGSEKDTDIDFEHKIRCVYSPKTELDALTEQFTKMIKRFSRSGTAKRADVAQIEVRNEFRLCKEFSDLYNSREDENFPFSYNREGAKKEAEEGVFGGKLKLNRGRNVHNHEKSASEATSYPTPTEFQTTVWASPLFWSIGTFIVLPLFVFSLIISVVVLTQISTFPELLEPVKEDFISLYDNYLYSSTALRASLASSLTEAVARDLHVISRYATWLFFGALNTTDSTVDMVGGAEECKSTPTGETCGWLKEQPCDCSWGWYKEGEACTNYDERNSRPLKQLHMASQRDDAWPDGTRNYTGIPFPTSPEATNWWTELSEMPGSSTSIVSDDNYGSSFQRAKTASAMAGVLIPFYNVLLDTSPPGLPGVPFLALMFEADGMVIGFSGCTPFSTVSPFWSSSETNGAAELQPQLCPLRKHGYDPRCRKWYDDGKKEAFVSGLHITSPYVFAGFDDVVAQTGTSSMVNLRTKEYIGQILLDFLPLSLIAMLESGTTLPKDGVSILITPDSNAVVGPGLSRKEADVSIKQLMLQSDDCISEPLAASCVQFDAIVEKMSDGRSGSDTFTRSTSTGQKETVRISYAPVSVKSFRAIDSSNFASGVEQDSNLIYSVALAAPEEPMLEPFHSVRDKTEADVTTGIIVISVLLVLALLLLVNFAYRVTKSLITSVLHLLNGKCTIPNRWF